MEDIISAVFAFFRNREERIFDLHVINLDHISFKNGTTTTEGSESEVQSASVNNEARTNTMVTSSDMTRSDADIRITFDVSHAMDKLREIFSQDQQKSDERCLLLHMYRGLERHRCNKNPTVE
ncbi:hypothetical protein NECAME_07353, partial [Necator americanus]